jgi:hypothetical protein
LKAALATAFFRNHIQKQERMQVISILQRFMGGTLTTGYFAHDYYYTSKYAGINVPSILFLLAMLWFHTIVFLLEAKLAEVISQASKKKIEYARIIITFYAVFFCLADCYEKIIEGADNFLTINNISSTLLSLFLVIFPGSVFKIIFVIKAKI